MPWNLGERVLGHSPTIIAAIRDDAAPAQLREAIAAGVHALELRIDSFSTREPAQVAETVQRLALAPTLATIRHAREGGDWDAPEAERLQLYRAVMPYVQAVDCELSAAEVAQELFGECHARGLLTIGSYHDFRACPDNVTLSGLINKAEQVGAKVLKVAAFCATNEDFRRLAMFTLCHAERGVVVIAMGPAGTPSRVLFPALGSLLTYTFLGNPTAPGQLNYQAMVEYVNGLYGGAAQ